MFDNNEIDKILKDIDFSIFDFDDFSVDWVEETFIYTEEYEYLVKNLNLKICYGATKLVFIPSKEYNFVIKIPFKGVYEDTCEGVEFMGFQNAEYPLTCEYGNDYCRSEMEYYQQAQESNVDKLFCGTFFYTNINNIPIYVSEKADKIGESFLNNDLTKQEYETTKDLIKKNNLHNVFNYSFFNKALNFVSIEYLQEFFTFLDDYQIHDLYNDNYGLLKNGCPVIIDYSDYRD